MMMPILNKYLWYYESSCCVCGLVLNTYNIMGNYAVYPARWNFWGGHFWKFAVPSRRGHKNYKSYLFHHLSVPSFWNEAGDSFQKCWCQLFGISMVCGPSPPPRYLACLYAQLGYLHRLFCKLGVKGVNTKVFTIFTPFTLNVSVNGVNSENCVYLS